MSATSQEEASGMSWLTLASGVLITLIMIVRARFHIVPNKQYHKFFVFPWLHLFADCHDGLDRAE
jgi:hypothetical protein